MHQHSVLVRTGLHPSLWKWPYGTTHSRFWQIITKGLSDGLHQQICAYKFNDTFIINEHVHIP